MFRQGAHLGLTPDQVLDMPFWQFQAFAEGSKDRALDEISLCVMTGYYSAYYANTKKPKTPTAIINQLINAKEVAGRSERTPIDLDKEIQRIQELDALFKQRGVHV